MAISWVGYGSGGGHISTVTVGYPPGIQAGDVLLILAGSKYPPAVPAAPSGFELLGTMSGGTSAQGADSGPATITVFKRIADGTESGTMDITAVGGTDVASVMIALRSDITNVWNIQASGGPRNSGGNPWTITTEGSLNIEAGDMVLAISCSNTDAGVPSNHSMTLSGVTLDSATERISFVSGVGDDVRVIMSHQTATSGSGTGTVTAFFNYSNTNANRPQGGTLVVVLRESEEAPVTPRRIFHI